MTANGAQEGEHPDPRSPGQRLREVRLARRLTLAQVAAEAGLTPSFVSQFERGKTNAAVGTLRRLCLALSIPLADLFAEKAPEWPTVLRAADRPRLVASEGVRKYALTRPPLNHVEVYVATFAPGTSTGDTAYAHGDSTEVFVVITGSIELELGGVIHQMRSGDSIEYQTSLPHKVINIGTCEAEVIWITSPPTSVIGENPHAQ